MGSYHPPVDGPLTPRSLGRRGRTTGRVPTAPGPLSWVPVRLDRPGVTSPSLGPLFQGLRLTPTRNPSLHSPVGPDDDLCRHTQASRLSVTRPSPTTPLPARLPPTGHTHPSRLRSYNFRPRRDGRRGSRTLSDHALLRALSACLPVSLRVCRRRRGRSPRRVFFVWGVDSRTYVPVPGPLPVPRGLDVWVLTHRGFGLWRT